MLFPKGTSHNNPKTWVVPSAVGITWGDATLSHEYSVRPSAASLYLGTCALLAAWCAWQAFSIYLYATISHRLWYRLWPLLWPCALIVLWSRWENALYEGRLGLSEASVWVGQPGVGRHVSHQRNQAPPLCQTWTLLLCTKESGICYKGVI